MTPRMYLTRNNTGSFTMISSFWILFVFCSQFVLSFASSNDDVKYATPCEVCKIVSFELKKRLEETGRNRDVIETGYSIEAKKPKKMYQTS